MKFSIQKQIRFHHCDPAGIVFYPQFFYLLHEVQEDFLAHIGYPEHQLIATGVGVPIVNLKTEFTGMCRNGDEVLITLDLPKLGHSSIGMHYEIHSYPRIIYAGQSPKSLKLMADAVVVHSTVPQGKPLRIPDGLRHALSPYLQTSLEEAP
ncbi:acyl-CoA thioesterase [Polaromonas sp.]|uniref:acyl-CoA thioesterase n=1 Tax=Polaromonas sp. TaxID=1869339 RepID=UPI002FC87215